jgi:23S rRNA pseudouridine2605 synthase
VSFGPFQLGRLPPGALDEVSGKVLREQLGALLAGKGAGSSYRDIKEKRARIPAPRPTL